MSLKVGDKLGPYEILAPIGAGGMGEVYRAKDPRLNRDVAIKVAAAQFSERFEREAKAIAALNHPHICTLHDIGPNYLVMEFLEGTPLYGPLPLDQALRCALQICDALDAAHKKNITHRDLKPGNILLTATGVKLLDFGLAKMGKPEAPPAFMPPHGRWVLRKQARFWAPRPTCRRNKPKGRRPTLARTYFHFGLVLYEMLSGRRAFSKGSAMETLAAVLRDEPAPLDVPAKLRAIVTRCLSKLPAARFQTIKEVSAALEQVTATPARNTPSIAVLPFANMSRDADDEYFSDGLAEEIINALSQMNGLKVIARTSAFAFKGKNEDIRKIAEALGVSNVLEGSVRRAGNRLRITAQLIHAADGSHLWSHRYDREMTDVFAIQDEISATIASQLKVSLMGPGGFRKHTPKFAAYEALLQGRHHALQFSSDGSARGLEYFQRAISIDPEYAEAHNGLAAFFLWSAAAGMADPRSALPKGRAAAQRALELDESLADAHTTLGVVSAQADYEWAEAGKHFRRALELDHASLSTSVQYAVWYLRPLGRLEEALTQLKELWQRDPLALWPRFESAAMLLLMRQYDAAADIVQQALELEPNNRFGLMRLIQARIGQEKYDQAVVLAEQLAQTDRKWIVSLELLGCAYASAGRLADARQVLAEMHDVGAKNSFLPATPIAAVNAALGDIDAAVNWLQRAIEQREPIITTLTVWPIFDAVRSHPGYPALLQKMNLA